jgi:CRP-like cAMP-binding protein
MTAHATDVIGEIGVLCYMPQPFTVRSKKLSQLLRLDRIVFMNIVQQYKEDGQRIVDNLLQVHHYSRCSPSLCFFFQLKRVHLQFS